LIQGVPKESLWFVTAKSSFRPLMLANKKHPRAFHSLHTAILSNKQLSFPNELQHAAGWHNFAHSSKPSTVAIVSAAQEFSSNCAGGDDNRVVLLPVRVACNSAWQTVYSRQAN
jgi:hypothetical protein